MFGFKHEKRWVKISLITICLFSLALSLFVVLSYGNYFLFGSMEKMNNDDVRYVRSASTLINQGTLVYYGDKPTTFIMPGISFTLAFFIKIFNVAGGIIAFRVFQSILYCLGILLVFLITREVMNSTMGLLACLIDAIYMPEYVNAGLLLTEGLFKFLLLLLVYLSLYALKSKKPSLYILGGVVWGLACLFRPTIVLYPTIIFIMWLIYRYNIKEMLKFSLITVSAFIVIMSPWWIRNYATFNKFVPLTESTGNPLLQGTYINYDRLKDKEYLKANGTSNKAQIDLAKKRIKENFSSEPLKYAYWYTIGKTYYFWSNAYYYKPILGISFFWVNVLHIIIIFLGFAGIFMTLKLNKLGILVASVIIYFNLIHLPYLTMARYSFPLMPLMIIMATFTLMKILMEGR